MSAPKGYTNIIAIENYLLVEIDIGFKDQVEEWIAQMEKYIEQETGRVFIADSDASVKKFQVEPFSPITIGDYRALPKELFIDECVEVAELKIDGEVISSDNYLFYPANELPKTRIKLTDASGLVFSRGEQNIEVKAKWGYSVECPDDISFATTILVAGTINFAGEMAGEIKSESIGSFSVTYKDEQGWQDFNRVKEILQKYTKIVT